MIASNLGQIVGRLMYGEDADQGQLPAGPALPPSVVVARGKRQKELIVFLASAAPHALGAADIAKGMGISLAHATVLLHTSLKNGLVRRSGDAHSFRYTLP